MEPPVGASVAPHRRTAMKHVGQTIEELRRYIARSEARADLEEVDALLSVALEEVRRKLAAQPRRKE